LAGGLLAAPLAAEAQPAGTVPRLGMLLMGSPSRPSAELDAFTKQLGELGWFEGQNLAVDRRFADRPDRFPDLSADLLRLKVSVILTPGPEATQAAKNSTSTTPIVMIALTDPQRMGVTSLARPGGNLTGLTIGQPEVVAEKRLQLLKEALPGISRVAVLWDVSRVFDARGAEEKMIAAARSLGLRLQHVEIRRLLDFDEAFKAAQKNGAGAVLLMESPRAGANRALIAELGLKNRLPIMSEFRHIVEVGGLLSYGADLTDLFRRAAFHVDKILKGAKPADLPVEEPTKFELVINLKTAKALGLTIPPSLLQRADQVIE
jgi:putative ABC transport system substrate-binding protein